MSSAVYSVQRIQNYIDELSQPPKYSAPIISGEGVTRLAFSKQETNAIDWARRKLESFGYDCRYDAFLNLHAHDPQKGKKRTLVGTHLDSVKAGGKYDGTVGLVSFLEALHLREEEQRDFSLPVDFILFRAEESTLFKVALLGSKVATGYYNLNDLQNIHFRWDEELEDAKIRMHLGYSRPEDEQVDLGPLTLFDMLSKHTDEFMAKIHEGCWFFAHKPEDYQAYFEIHIEQGRVLERKTKDFGIVTSFRAPLRMIFTLKGRTDHSGATPMGPEYRRDVLCAASECILAIERICEEESQKGVDIVGTVGEVHIPFMGINKVPGKCDFTLDLRSSNREERERVYKGIHKKIVNITKRRDIKLEEEQTENSQPVCLGDNERAAKLRDRMVDVIEKLGYSYKFIPSGAGHDAQQMAQADIPVCMLFVPCKNGVSHSPEEKAEAEDILKASRTLLTILTERWP